MGPKHETRTALNPVDGTVVCQSHQQAIENVYEAIKDVSNSKMSRSQTMWVVGLLVAVASAYGMMLWNNTSAACSKNDENFTAIDRRVLTLELRWQGVLAQLDRIEAEQKAIRTETGTLRAETNAQLEGIRRLVQEKKTP